MTAAPAPRLQRSAAATKPCVRKALVGRHQQSTCRRHFTPVGPGLHVSHQCADRRISDGTSNTIAVIEDAGRCSPMSFTNGQAPYYCLSTYLDNMATRLPVIGPLLPDDITGDATGATTGTSAHGVWRWADADACGSGISGPFGDTDTAGPYTGQ